MVPAVFRRQHHHTTLGIGANHRRLKAD